MSMLVVYVMYQVQLFMDAPLTKRWASRTEMSAELQHGPLSDDLQAATANQGNSAHSRGSHRSNDTSEHQMVHVVKSASSSSRPELGDFLMTSSGKEVRFGLKIYLMDSKTPLIRLLRLTGDSAKLVRFGGAFAASGFASAKLERFSGASGIGAAPVVAPASEMSTCDTRALASDVRSA